MKITFKIILIILFFVNLTYFFSNNNDDMIIDKIYNILIVEYDNHKGKSFDEKFVLKFSKKAFMDSILIWKQNYKDINNIKIVLHPKLQDITVVVDENLPKEKSEHFKELLTELSFIAYKNLNIYYLSVKDYLQINKLNYENITIGLIEDALCQPKYFKDKINLYNREDEIKIEVRAVMKDDKVKIKLFFYVFAFDYLNKIRKKIIEKDIAKMKAKMIELNIQL